MDVFYFILQQTWYFAIPLLVVALGGLFSERSGVVNIALEGMMIMGAFASILFINIVQKSESNITGQNLLILAVLIAGTTGALFSVLHAFSSITMKANQVISGTALNLFAPAFAIFIARTMYNVMQIQFINVFRIKEVPVLSRIPIFGKIFFTNMYLTTIIGIVILIVTIFVMNKTRFGLRLKACGENPQAADSVGINVYRIRYVSVIISGFLAGIGGLIFVLPTSTEFSGTVAGYGFLALAVLIFGKWRPVRILFAALFFGLMKTISASYSIIPLLSNLGLHSNIYKMVPFVATLIVLAFSSKSSNVPKASGEPYEKGS